MKTINETFDDEEYSELMKHKRKLSWHDFIMLLTLYEPDDEQNEKEK